MADNFDSFSNESLKNVESIRSSMLSIKDSAGKFSRALGEAGERTTDYRTEFAKILNSSRQFNILQESAKNSSKGIEDALKQQNVQLNVVKNLNNQIDILYLKASKETGEIKYNLEKQANALSAARDNSSELAKEYGNLAKDSSNLNKSTAFFSGLSNIAKDIPGLRKLSGPFEAAAKASRETVLNNAKLKAEGATTAPKSQLMAGLQGGAASALSSIKDIFTSGGWIGALVKGIQMLIEVMFEADKQVTDIAKNFVVSKDRASDIRDSFTRLTEKAGTFTKLQEGNLLLQKEIVEANFKINDLLGISVNLSKTRNQEGEKLVTQFADASKFLALSDEEQKGLLDTTVTTGKEVESINETILGTASLRKLESGILINERKILRDVLTLNNANKLTIKGGAEGLANAAFAAAKLGSNLKTVEGISKSLLQFEDSITSEIEAELLLGKEFNFEVARTAALFGDLETVAKEVTNQIGSAGEFSRMNVIQQDALAKTFGLQREELADILVQQENLNKLKDVYNTRAKDEIENLVLKGKIDKKILAQIEGGGGTIKDYFKVLQQAIPEQEKLVSLLGAETLASLKSQDAQAKFSDALEKAKEIFSTLVSGGILDTIANKLTDFALALSQGKNILTASFTDYSQAERFKIQEENLKSKISKERSPIEKEELESQLKKLQEDKENYINSLKSDSRIEFDKKNTPEKAEDFIIRPGQPIQKFRKDDVVIGGTNLFGGSQDNTKMITLLEKLIATVEKGGNVYMDGTLVGNTTVMANSKMG